MSPEPTQEPIQENLTISSVALDARATNDEEDSDDEDMGMAGYVPLSQVSTDADPILDEEENDEWLSGFSESSQASSVLTTETQQSCSSEILEVWSCPNNRSDIDLDATKIKEVKSVMASITIPETSIPQWANTISEEQWKEQLLMRIKQMQNKDS
ncbi:male-enhanced antigen 1 [Pogonomyrmex barbatus]|uniref:Male-enhanced antigen 1 n=1 Tax=Pogonomyrmex barbatus TaxID=144034 RepID=A0A6I9WSN5_9HYME|nr:male-enhanced antigen 1 [Pogonomyrmex barbatus]XP_011646977.1 male-enhanced antigen 1 [Pogonomyrmex barbatus]XP_011646978.1 male-enhanced antigen 1 [Pogonomyrmex barbatus]